jgi:hypothetical protein
MQLRPASWKCAFFFAIFELGVTYVSCSSSLHTIHDIASSIGAADGAENQRQHQWHALLKKLKHTLKHKKNHTKQHPEAPKDKKVHEIASSTFKVLDADSDTYLNQEELRHVANYFGFKGSDSKWAQVYKSLSIDHGFTNTGMDLATFDGFIHAALVSNDDLSSMFLDHPVEALAEAIAHDAQSKVSLNASQDAKPDPATIKEEHHHHHHHHQHVAQNVTERGLPEEVAHNATERDAEIVKNEEIPQSNKSEKQEATERENATSQSPELTTEHLSNHSTIEEPPKENSSFKGALRPTKKGHDLIKKEQVFEGMNIENFGFNLHFLNVEGNKKKNGARLQLWDDQTSASGHWQIRRVPGAAAEYTIESVSAPGMYVSAGPHGEGVQLRDNLTLSASQLWRIQNVAGNVDAYIFENVNTSKYLTATGNSQGHRNKSTRAANVTLGDNPTPINAHWSIHAPRGQSSSRNGSQPLQGVWRKVSGCFDSDGFKVSRVACPPTQAPTSKPTKVPTPSPTPKPTVKGHWSVRMSCNDAHGNKIDPKNCAAFKNEHAIESTHHKTR